MAYMLGAIIGAIIITFLLNRLGAFLFRKVSPDRTRILLANGVAFAFAVIVGGLGYADGGPPRFLYAASLYVLPALGWMAIDFLALKGRAAKAKSQD